MCKVSVASLALFVLPVLAQSPQVPPLRSGNAVMVMSATAPTVLFNQYVAEVGAHTNSNSAFLWLKTDLPECKWGVVYIDLGTNGGRAAYSTALSARRSEMQLARISYAVQADGTCLADQLAG